MRCVRCGFHESRHIRADGACIDYPQCKVFLASWGADDVADFAAMKALEASKPVAMPPTDEHEDAK